MDSRSLRGVINNWHSSRRFLGIEQEEEFASLGKARRIELNLLGVKDGYIDKLNDLSFQHFTSAVHESEVEYGIDLPF